MITGDNAWASEGPRKSQPTLKTLPVCHLAKSGWVIVSERRHVAYPTGRATPTSIACGPKLRGRDCRTIMTITVEQRRALKMLADASTRVCAEAVLRAHGFGASMLAELIDAGFVSRMPEQVRAGARSVDVARLRITPVGRGMIR